MATEFTCRLIGAPPQKGQATLRLESNAKDGTRVFVVTDDGRELELQDVAEAHFTADCENPTRTKLVVMNVQAKLEAEELGVEERVIDPPPLRFRS